MDYKIISTNKRYIPTEFKTYELNVNCNTVLVEGVIGDYAAYQGIGSDQWVAAHGNKLSFTEARCHFPGITESKYRS